jgi:hypothetical protein
MAGADVPVSNALKAELRRERGLLRLFAPCVLIFLVSIPLPRADGHLISPDWASSRCPPPSPSAI